MVRVWLVVLLAVGLVPTAAGTIKCDKVETDAPGAGGYYLFDAGTSYQVWRETNGVEGLQRVLCKDADGSRAQADTRLATIPTALALRDPL